MMDLKHLSGDEILRAVGLQTRASASDYILPALGIFGAGLLVGAGLGLLLAPKPGRELRSEIRGAARRATHRGDGADEGALDIGAQAS